MRASEPPMRESRVANLGNCTAFVGISVYSLNCHFVYTISLQIVNKSKTIYFISPPSCLSRPMNRIILEPCFRSHNSVQRERSSAGARRTLHARLRLVLQPFGELKTNKDP